MTSKTVEMKGCSVICYYETEDVLFLGTEEGKLFLLGQNFKMICTIDIGSRILSLSCVDDHNLIVSVENAILRYFNI